MYLHLNDLLPVYFDENKKKDSEIWGRDLSFNNGEFIKVVAPSGSGKTSLIHFLYGLSKEYTGIISYDNQQIKTLSAEHFSIYRNKHISIVLQDMRLFPDLTVCENIEIKRQLNPFHKPERIKEMASRLGITEKLESKCRNCSYGEQQRIAIIRSLMQPFDFLLLDEPFSHLDNNNAQKAMELILEEASERNAGIVFADLERIDFFPYTKIYYL